MRVDILVDERAEAAQDIGVTQVERDHRLRKGAGRKISAGCAEEVCCLLPAAKPLLSWAAAMAARGHYPTAPTLTEG